MTKPRWAGMHVALTVVVVLSMSLTSCTKQADEGEKELLVYCGITMIKPMNDIAKIIETQHKCKIIVTKGGSGNLLRCIQTTGQGDLYLPGSDSYITQCVAEGLIDEADTVHVGYNKAAMMVAKGNPKNVSADLMNLADKRYRVMIGDANSGSIGRETAKVLTKRGIYDQVKQNARKFSTDSKGLINALCDGTADIVINWYATSMWEPNVEHVDALGIDEEYATKKSLVLGLLKSSRHPDIARAFMEYAAGEKGQALFVKYGLYDVK